MIRDYEPGNEPVTLSRNDLYMLLVSAQRYAMGRMSYVVGTTAESVQRYWKHLTQAERAVLLRDLREEIQAAEDMNRTLGMQMDHVVWVDLKDWMETHFAD